MRRRTLRLLLLSDALSPLGYRALLSLFCLLLHSVNKIAFGTQSEPPQLRRQGLREVCEIELLVSFERAVLALEGIALALELLLSSQ